MYKSRGFTLVEIAIVLVIIGLLIGGILRGQELITAARVRNLIDQKTSIQAAHFGFLDRFRLLPGDLTVEQAALVNNGAMPDLEQPANGLVLYWQSPAYFNNLAQAGFISCSQCMAKLTVFPPNPTTTTNPTNIYGSPIWVANGANGTNDAWAYLTPVGIIEPRHFRMPTGGNVPSTILAEMDRKMDDGDPSGGKFRATSFNWGSITPFNTCVNTTTYKAWIADDPGLCQGVSLL
jgi:prepilin-type N-terminal cleavage/methylation domain-containing protein